MSACKPTPLARNGVAHVQRCPECGTVSVHLGPITVRLDPASLEALWAVLGEAIATLATQQVAVRPHRNPSGFIS